MGKGKEIKLPKGPIMRGGGGGGGGGGGVFHVRH